MTTKELTMDTAHDTEHDPDRPTSMLTIDEAARYLCIPKATLYTWRTRRVGYGPRAVRFGSCLRYRLTDLDAWIDEHLESFSDDHDPLDAEMPKPADGQSLSRASHPR